MTRNDWIATSIVFAIVLSVHAWWLMRYPDPFVDEGWSGARAWGFVHTGHQFGTLDAGVFDRYEGYWTSLPFIPTALQSIPYFFTSHPTLRAMRGVSLGAGMALLAALFAIGYRVGGPRMGMLAVVIAAFSWPFVYSSHLARFDVIAAAFGFAGVALHFNNERERVWMAALSGLCLGLAPEVHAHAAIFAPAVGVLYLLEYRLSLFKKRHFWAFVLGGLGGGIVYLALHILPYPESYAAINKIAFAPSHVPPILMRDAAALWGAVSEFRELLDIVAGPTVPFAVLGAICLVVWRSKRDLLLVAFAVALAAAFALLIRNKFAYYAILYTPALDLVVAAFVYRCFERSLWHRTIAYPVRAIACAVLLYCPYQNLSEISLLPPDALDATDRRIAEVIQPTDRIMGPQTYWFGLYEHPYYSWETLVYYRRLVPGSTFEDGMIEFRPDIYIIDAHTANFIWDGTSDSAYMESLRLSETETNAFFNTYGDKVLDYDDPVCGRIQVYRIRWEE